MALDAGRLRLGQLVELVELGLQQLLVRQPGLVLGDERRRHGPAQGVLDDLVVLRRAEQHADGRPLVRLLHVAVEGLQVELQFAEMLGLELVDLEFEGDQGVESPVEEEQVEGEVPPADLERVLAADEAEVAAELDQELLELLDQAALQVGLGVAGRQVEELDEIAVLEDARRRGAILSAVVRVLPETGPSARTGHRRAAVPARGLTISGRGQAEVELALLVPLALAQMSRLWVQDNSRSSAESFGWSR